MVYVLLLGLEPVIKFNSHVLVPPSSQDASGAESGAAPESPADRHEDGVHGRGVQEHSRAPGVRTAEDPRGAEQPAG